MADRGDRAAVVPDELERPHILFLDAACVLMWCGAVGVVTIATNPGGCNAAQAFNFFLVWLLGVCFLAPSPMADYGDRAAVVPGERERPQILFLDAARVLMLCGAIGVVTIAANPEGRNAAQAFIFFLVWLLGVCFQFLAPSPMADHGDRAAVVPGERERPQNLFLDAARVLMLCGTVGVVIIAANPGGGNAALAFVFFLLWLFGVCFLAFAPAAGRYTRGA